MREMNYDVLAVSESWLNSSVTNAAVEIEGYKLTRLDRLRKTGGGVCLYTRSLLKVKRLNDMSSISDSGFHQLWVQIQLKRLRSIILCVVYRPDYCPVSCFFDDFMDKYSQALILGKDIVITGDLNCDLLKPRSREAVALYDLCSSVNLTQLIQEPTRVTETSSTLIDVMMTSNIGFVEESGVLQSHISDHYLVYATFKLKLPKLIPHFVKVRSYRKYESHRFLSDLEQVPWHDIALIDDANEMLDQFNNSFLEVLEWHAPVKTVKIKHRRCPFVDSQIKECMRDRDRLLKRARCIGSSVDWEIYRVSRQLVKTRLRKAEEDYIKKELKGCQKTSSKWKVIRDFIPRREKTQRVYTKDLKEVVDNFNNFFTSVGAKASEASKTLIDLHHLPLSTDINARQEIFEWDMFQFHSVSTYEIHKIVMSFPSNKAPGYDRVSMSVIKDALPCILPILTDIVNRSLLSSVFPAAWKTSEVVPLLKEGDHEVANNNRPISLLPAASKICERVALNQLTTYMSNKKRLNEHQSGNRKQHSCETLHVLTADSVLEAMDAKKLTILVLLDLSKAFDSIDHAKLLTKLQTLGVSRSTLEWFRSYLLERRQYVRIGAETSGFGYLSHGVPQGSILGPALFNIYLNDLSSIPKFGGLESFVDDSKLYLSFPIADVCNVVEQINEDLFNIAGWCCHNSLLINPGKTKLLVFGTRQMLKKLPNDFHVVLLGKNIFPSSSAQDLGLQVDCTLSYDEHITNTVSSCTGSLCQINRVKHLLDTSTLENVVNALVFSRLYYCSSVWSNTAKKNIVKLQKVQNFAARIITGARKFDHITPVLKELNWLPVDSVLKYKDGILAFKCVKGLAPNYLSERFITRSLVHNRNTRNKDGLNIPACRSASGQRTFLYRAISLWNSLPREITDTSSLRTFKKGLRKLLFNSCFS